MRRKQNDCEHLQVEVHDVKYRKVVMRCLNCNLLFCVIDLVIFWRKTADRPRPIDPGTLDHKP